MAQFLTQSDVMESVNRFAAIHNSVGLDRDRVDAVADERFFRDCVAGNGLEFDLPFEELDSLFEEEERHNMEEGLQDELQEEEEKNDCKSLRNSQLVRYCNLVRADESDSGSGGVFASKNKSFFDLMEAYGLPMEDPLVYEEILKFRLGGSSEGRTLIRVKEIGPFVQEGLNEILHDVNTGRLKNGDDFFANLSADKTRLPTMDKIKTSLVNDCLLFMAMRAASDLIYERSSDEVKKCYSNKKDFSAIFVPPRFNMRRSLRLLVLVFAISDGAEMQSRNFMNRLLLCPDILFVEYGLLSLEETELQTNHTQFAYRAEQKLRVMFTNSNIDFRSGKRSGDPWTLGTIPLSFLREQLVICNVCKYYVDSLKRDKNQAHNSYKKKWDAVVRAKKTLFQKMVDLEQAVTDDAPQHGIIQRHRNDWLSFGNSFLQMGYDMNRSFR